MQGIKSMRDGTEIIVVGSDHTGLSLKENIIKYILERGLKVIDVGTIHARIISFPDITRLLCKEILRKRAHRGVIICESPVGASIAANRLRDIRAAVCHDSHCARRCIEHDNVNVMCIANDVGWRGDIHELMKAFVDAKFDASECSSRRVDNYDLLPLTWTDLF